jgi:hypothetical protein
MEQVNKLQYFKSSNGTYVFNISASMFRGFQVPTAIASNFAKNLALQHFGFDLASVFGFDLGALGFPLSFKEPLERGHVGLHSEKYVIPDSCRPKTMDMRRTDFRSFIYPFLLIM